MARQDKNIKSYLTTFKGIFNSPDFKIRTELIRVPMIQRDYAQGRVSETRVRNRFLKALFAAIDSSDAKSIVLDFVYGIRKSDKIIEKAIFEPIDGQQRLTTLYLLHLYLSKRFFGSDFVDNEETEWLNGFSYETRNSSKRFCEELFEMPWESVKDLDGYLTSMPWFTGRYKSDPTISAMRKTFSDIAAHYNSIPDEEIEGIWKRLDNIRFQLLYLPDLDVTDDLYIKMNSRGLHLTDFELFKADLEGYFKTDDKSWILEDKKMNFSLQIDTDWTNLLWDYRNQDKDDIYIEDFSQYDKENNSPYAENGLDNRFHHIFRRFMCMEAAKDSVRLYEDDYVDFWDNTDADLVSLAEKIFRDTTPQVRKSRIQRLSKFLNFLYKKMEEGVEGSYVDTLLYRESDNPSKEIKQSNIRWFANNIVFNLLETVSSQEALGLAPTLLLEAFIARANVADLDEKVFRQRLRAVRNLIANDSLTAESMGKMLKRIDAIIEKGDFGLDASDFTISQKKQEVLKIEWEKENPSLIGLKNEIENHGVIRGDLSAFLISLPKEKSQIETVKILKDYFKPFLNIFTDVEESCEWKLRHQALLAIADYATKEGDMRLYGSDSWWYWREYVFRKNNDNHTYQTFRRMLELLGNSLDPNTALNQLREKYLSECENEEQPSYPWRYYMVRYKGVLKGEERAVSKKSGHEYKVITWNKKSGRGNHWNPFLYRISIQEDLKDRFSLGKWDNWLQIDKVKLWVKCEEYYYDIQPYNHEEVNFELKIDHDPNTGYDRVDRIQLFLDFYRALEPLILNRDKEGLLKLAETYKITHQGPERPFTDILLTDPPEPISTEENNE